MTTFRKNSLERFVDAVQIATLSADTPTSSTLALLQRAAPVARTIAITGDPLAGSGVCDPLDAFIHAEEARAVRETSDDTDPDHECARAAAREDALYYAGICVGLLLSDLV